MEQKHPHADAAYRIVRHADSAFGVEVTIPDTYPTTVTSFATEAAAEAWVLAHKQRVTEALGRRRWSKKRSP